MNTRCCCGSWLCLEGSYWEPWVLSWKASEPASYNRAAQVLGKLRLFRDHRSMVNAAFFLRLVLFAAFAGAALFWLRSLRLEPGSPMRQGLYAAGAALAFFLIGANVVSRHGAIAWYRMVHFGQPVEAMITRREPHDHARCFFKYSVASRYYEASDTECHSEVGQVISVRYLPTDPSFVTLQSPNDNLAFVTIAPVLMSGVAGLFAALRARSRLRATV